MGAMRLVAVLGTALLLGSFAGSAWAKAITYRFEAIVTGVNDVYPDLVLAQVPVGGWIYGSFTYDPDGSQYQAAPSGIRVKIGEVLLSTTPRYEQLPYDRLCCSSGGGSEFPYIRRPGSGDIEESISITAGWDDQSAVSSFAISGISYDPNLQLLGADVAGVSIRLRNVPSTSVVPASHLPTSLSLLDFDSAGLSIGADRYDGVYDSPSDDDVSCSYVAPVDGMWVLGATIVSLRVPESGSLLLLGFASGAAIVVRMSGRFVRSFVS